VTELGILDRNQFVNTLIRIAVGFLAIFGWPDSRERAAKRLVASAGERKVPDFMFLDEAEAQDTCNGDNGDGDGGDGGGGGDAFCYYTESGWGCY
jgi:hypothetical protein